MTTTDRVSGYRLMVEVEEMAIELEDLERQYTDASRKAELARTKATGIYYRSEKIKARIIATNEAIEALLRRDEMIVDVVNEWRKQAKEEARGASHTAGDKGGGGA